MQIKTGELGISVPEYVRHLIINDVEKMYVEIVTLEMDYEILRKESRDLSISN